MLRIICRTAHAIKRNAMPIAGIILAITAIWYAWEISTFNSLSESDAKWWLRWSEALLLGSAILLTAGLFGEWPDSESWKKRALYKASKAAVIIGVLGELLGDGGIFAAGDRVESLDNAKIIALETRLAARSISDEQLETIASQLKSFAPQTYQIIPYWKNPESLALANRISAGLTKAGWVLQNPDRFTTLVGVLTGITVSVDKGASDSVKKAGAELLKALKGADIAAEPDDEINNPPSQRINMQIGIKP
jgi:hypothetical protein